MIPDEWYDQVEKLMQDIIHPSQFISVHHLEAPWCVARDLARLTILGILDEWNDATVYYGTRASQKESLQKSIAQTDPDYVDAIRLLDYTQLAQVIESTSFAATTSLVIVLEVDVDMAIGYVDCISSISQKLVDAPLNLQDTEGGIRLLTVASDPFDSRLQKLLECPRTSKQFAWPRRHSIRIEWPNECLIKQGPLLGLPRHIGTLRGAGGPYDLQAASNNPTTIDGPINGRQLLLEISALINNSNKAFQVVVCFEPWHDIGELSSKCQGMLKNIASHQVFLQRRANGDDDRLMELKEAFLHWLDEAESMRDHHRQQRESGSEQDEMKHIFFAFIHSGTLPCREMLLRLSDPTWNLTLVLGGGKANNLYHQPIHQSHVKHIPVGIIEQWDQLAWLAAIPGDAVVVDQFCWASLAAAKWRARCAGGRNSLDENGAQYRRVGSSDVEGGRLADFLVLLASKQKQGSITELHSKRIIDSLMKKCRPWRQMSTMLAYQGVLSRKERFLTRADSRSMQLGNFDRTCLPRFPELGLESPEIDIQLLRCTKYDYRLAHLLAGHSTNTGSDLCKILLVAAIQSGMDQIVLDSGELDNLATTGSPGQYDVGALAEPATGIMSEIAALGTWWLKISLWHSVAWSSTKFLEAILNGGNPPVTYDKIFPNGKQCQVLHSVTEDMKNRVMALGKVLDKLHRAGQPPLNMLPLGQDIVPKKSLDMFFQQLTDAFILDLVTCRWHKRDGKIIIQVHKVYGGLMMEPRWGYMKAMIHRILSRQPTDYIFGIAPSLPIEELKQKGRRVHLMDEWIWIPNQFVFNWHARHHPNQPFLSGILKAT